jgi:hypothetical protein
MLDKFNVRITINIIFRASAVCVIQFNKIKKLNEKKEESCKGVESNNEELKKLEEN